MTPAEKVAAKKKPRRTPEKRPAGPLKNSLRDRRQKLRLSLRDVVDATGVCLTSVCYAERGADLMLSTAVRLAKFYGSTVDEIWGLKPKAREST